MSKNIPVFPLLLVIEFKIMSPISEFQKYKSRINISVDSYCNHLLFLAKNTKCSGENLRIYITFAFNNNMIATFKMLG